MKWGLLRFFLLMGPALNPLADCFMKYHLTHVQFHFFLSGDCSSSERAEDQEKEGRGEKEERGRGGGKDGRRNRRERKGG